MSEMKTLTIDGTTYEVVDEAARSVTENANLVEYASDILQTLGGTTISLDGVKIATGSYTGTGTYGADNPCSLTFDFPPKLLFITGYKHSYTYTNAVYRTTVFGRVLQSGSSYISAMDCTMLPTEYVNDLSGNSGFEFDNGGIAGGNAKKSQDGKTIYWYNDISASRQYNYSGTEDIYEYYYFAIG